MSVKSNQHNTISGVLELSETSRFCVVIVQQPMISLFMCLYIYALLYTSFTRVQNLKQIHEKSNEL